MAETATLHPSENTSSLRAEAPSFTAGQPRELRPSNLRHLRTNPHPGRALDAALDYIPFTPSQGIITPSPSHLAGGHYEQQMLMYPFTPQGTAPAISEEGSGDSRQSFTTFSPFRWPMPVSPTAFPVQQEAYMVSGTGIESTSGLNGMPGMLPVTTQDYLYHMQIPPGSPVYVRSPSPFTTNHSWNPSCRPPSRLSGMQSPGPIYLTMPTPGSPVYQSSMNPVDFPQALNVGLVYPYNSNSPVASPRWQTSAHLPYHLQGPPTPPRNSRFSSAPVPFRTFMPAGPSHLDAGRSSTVTEGIPERPNPIGLGGSFLQGIYPGLEGQVPMNARQRRTARRKAEREAKARAEEEARQEASQMSSKASPVGPPEPEQKPSAKELSSPDDSRAAAPRPEGLTNDE